MCATWLKISKNVAAQRSFSKPSSFCLHWPLLFLHIRMFPTGNKGQNHWKYQQLNIWDRKKNHNKTQLIGIPESDFLKHIPQLQAGATQARSTDRRDGVDGQQPPPAPTIGEQDNPTRAVPYPHEDECTLYAAASTTAWRDYLIFLRLYSQVLVAFSFSPLLHSRIYLDTEPVSDWYKNTLRSTLFLKSSMYLYPGWLHKTKLQLN